MNKIFKKSLALTVSAALCLTAFIGCLSVSAETVTPVVGNITIGSAEVQVGSTDEFTLPVTIEKGTKGITQCKTTFIISTIVKHFKSQIQVLSRPRESSGIPALNADQNGRV